MGNMNLRELEKKIYSQNGEDGVLRAIFDAVGDGNKTFVEIGSGRESTWVNRDFSGNSGQNNTRALFRSGWDGKWFDMQGKGTVVKVKITAEDVLSTMAAHGVPAEPDLLSLDIDGNDYWVLREFLKAHSPRVMVCEYNASRPASENSVIAYDPGFGWSGTDYFGASLLALEELAREHGMALVHCESNGVNAFFVRSEHAAAFGVSPASPPNVSALYRPPGYKTGGNKIGGHRRDGSRTMKHPSTPGWGPTPR